MENHKKNEQIVLSKFSGRFIEKYSLRATTNQALYVLVMGGDVYHVLEQVLSMYEDHVIATTNAEIIKAAHGPMPQIICMTQEAMDSFKLDREQKDITAIKESFPFEDETKPGRWWNADNTDFRDL